MALIKITDLTAQLGLTSRSLRYYEQVGLVQSVRPTEEKYRFYDEENIARLQQIIVLRKMLIPVKDIIRIFESEDMRIVAETFTARIAAIDREVAELEELRAVVNDFLQEMLSKGVKKISALPLLYEGFERRLVRQPRSIAPAIIFLPAIPMVSSQLKENYLISNTEAFWLWVERNSLPQGASGTHERFEYQTPQGDVVMLRAPHNLPADNPYREFVFEGGWFAATEVYLDDDIGEAFRAMLADFDQNKFYEIDYTHEGTLRHEALIEPLRSPDPQRVLVSLLVPVKKRLPDPALYGAPNEVKAILLDTLEAINPTVWAEEVAADRLTPVNNPHYRVTENNEVEYTGWISTRVLDTGVKVKLPYRVDLAFRLEDSTGGFANGTTEGSICLYHGHHAMDHNPAMLGINMGGNADPLRSCEAIRFRQPLFHDEFDFPKRGAVQKGWNTLTWIIGAAHLACIINGEVRYCGENFPYMHLDLSHEDALPIIIGSDGGRMKYFRNIRISQLSQPKIKLKEGVLTMTTQQSNNLLPIIHRLVTDEYGENYWLNGCAKYVMECLGETDYDYWFFAGISGDLFTQFYPKSRIFGGEAYSSTFFHDGMGAFSETLFEKCGYASTYVTGAALAKNKTMYRELLVRYIDKGVPVISWGLGSPSIAGVFVGYEEHGQTLLYITGNKNEPERITFEDALKDVPDENGYVFGGGFGGWIFVGEKTHTRSLAEMYRDAINNLPHLLTHETPGFYFGANAFRQWAQTIESGWFSEITPEKFDAWAMHTNFICVLATNGSCCHGFLKKAQELNPDMTQLEEISRLYTRTAQIWNNDNGADLEALGGGFNVTLAALQDETRRTKIAQKIREAAECIDRVLEILKD
ncbi:MAG: MerR family transcriptional regulator [Defluviitaleaceae bacterium]|nr:MerR family transcriptional regulator [Defluviitaleaceae bacterium]MCL2275923.1 MerR family transcriptional regulator [Defluviitaleaceae bacterium]